jgi:hypothetical protein
MSVGRGGGAVDGIRRVKDGMVGSELMIECRLFEMSQSLLLNFWSTDLTLLQNQWSWVHDLLCTRLTTC